MATLVDVELHFAKEKHARWAAHVVRNLVALYYAPCDGLDLDPDASPMGKAELCLSQEALLSAYDLQEHYCDTALDRMVRDGRCITLGDLSYIQQTINLDSVYGYDEFFPQLCFALAMRYPQVCFTAYSRFEMNVSGAVERIRASWNGERLRFRKISGELPFDEDAWDTWDIYDWTLRDGTFEQVKEAQSLLQEHYFSMLEEARELAGAGDARAALRLVDDAIALPGCPLAPAIEARAAVGRSLRRRGIRRFVNLSGSTPKDLLERCERPLIELPMDVGTHVLRKSGRLVLDVDTATGTTNAELELWDDESKAYLLDGLYIVDVPSVASVYRCYLVDWEYEV